MSTVNVLLLDQADDTPLTERHSCLVSQYLNQEEGLRKMYYYKNIDIQNLSQKRL